jgi:lipoxygenase
MQALAEKRLFVQDYHDIFLPYIERINAQKLGSMYATRTVVFLTSEGILTPLAIELSLPPSSAGSAKQSRVFTPPPPDSTKNWVWELAKAHVASVDMSYHEVVSHL